LGDGSSIHGAGKENVRGWRYDRLGASYLAYGSLERNMNLFLSTRKKTDQHEALTVGVKNFIRKMPLVANGEALIGFVLLVTGVAIARDGVYRLQELWGVFRPFFPLSLSNSVAEWAMWSFPFIFSTFITVIGSICAVVIGALWLFSGLIEMVQSRRKPITPGEFAHPELTPEALRSVKVEHWKSFPRGFRLLATHWRHVRLLSPVSVQIVRESMISVAKIVLLGLLIAGFLAALPLIPALIRNLTQVSFTLLVPSGRPLYFLLALLICADVLICLSVFPFRAVQFDRSRETMPVRGGGDPHLFFALLEESCRLLSPKGGTSVAPTRLECKSDPSIKGTLIESRPEAVQSFLRPAGYVCLPLVFLSVTMGFSRLVHFRGSSEPMHYTQFIGTQALAYLMEVAFALGLILSGLYLAQWARKLFAVRKFGSSLVFCGMGPNGKPVAAGPEATKELSRHRVTPAIEWTVARDVDDQLAAWAMRPQNATKFNVELCWAHVSTESAEADGPRFLVNLSKSEALESAMKRILEIPFHVNFRADNSGHRESEETKPASHPPVKATPKVAPEE
jgi:hypothetical protein